MKNTSIKNSGRRWLFCNFAIFTYLGKDFFNVFHLDKFKIYVWEKFHQLSSTDECFEFSWKKGLTIGFSSPIRHKHQTLSQVVLLTPHTFPWLLLAPPLSPRNVMTLTDFSWLFLMQWNHTSLHNMLFKMCCWPREWRGYTAFPGSKTMTKITICFFIMCLAKVINIQL